MYFYLFVLFRDCPLSKLSLESSFSSGNDLQTASLLCLCNVQVCCVSTADRLAQLIEYRTSVWEVMGSTLRVFK